MIFFTRVREIFYSLKAVKTKTAKVILPRQSGGPAMAGSITLRPHLAMGLPVRWTNVKLIFDERQVKM